MADILRLYETLFDPRDYYNDYYLEDHMNIKEYLLDFLHRLFKEGKLRGKNLVEIGSACTIQSAITASAYVEEIYLSDVLEKCRNELEMWLRNDPEAIDHSRQLKYVANLEGHNDIKKLADRIRKTVKGVVPCDILKENPLYPMKAKFDIVTSVFVADCYNNPKDFIQAYKNISSLIREGGFAVIAATVNSKSYMVGKTLLPGPQMSKEACLAAMKDAKIEVLETFDYNLKECEIAEVEGLLYMYGKKL